MLSRITTVLAEDRLGIENARVLFKEYEAELNVDLCFQSFEEELATLPGKYAFPRGRLLIAYDASDHPIGCGAFRPIDVPASPERPDTGPVCEMKRLYVRPDFRGKRIGLKIARGLLYDAECEGYATMRLDTLGRLGPALELYRSLGFVEIEPYYDNPESDVVFMERRLAVLS